MKALLLAAGLALTWQDAADCIVYAGENARYYVSEWAPNHDAAEQLAFDDCAAKKRLEAFLKNNPQVQYGGPR